MEVINKNPIVFLISGKARHGKDSIANFIKEEYKKIDKKVLNLSFGSYIKMYAKNISDWDGSDDTKPRALLQQLGTEIIRNNIDNDFFAHRIYEDIKVYSYFFDVLTVSDVRFVNEVTKLEKINNRVIKIRVIRSNFTNNLDNNAKKHQSEIDLDNYNDYDFLINNNGSLIELKNKVSKLVEVIK
ncbi:MAG: hypothetical protein RR847_01445 [Bacilli bacterium]